MTPENAIQILDQATAALQCNRHDHINIQKSLSVLSGIVAEYQVSLQERENKTASDEPDDGDSQEVDPEA